MEEKFKDEDDEIIDLTDLLEEGTPPKEEESTEDEEEAVLKDTDLGTEPETFDLGKEITMEDDVSIEDIEGVDEALNIDVAISSDEEAVLTEDETSEEIIETQPPIEVDKVSAQPEEDTGQPEEEMKAPAEEEVEAPAEEDTGQPEEEAGAPISESEQTVEETPIEVRPGPDVTETDVQEIKKEIPAMLEGVIRPIMGELVKEVISATRDLLPGIVEKVIREEIEKLKKIE